MRDMSPQALPARSQGERLLTARLLVACLQAALLLGAWLLAPIPARADHGGPNPSEGVDFKQRLEAYLPLDLNFRDEDGQAVKLGDYFGQKPVILVFAYYECPMLCTLALNDLTAALRDVDFQVGEQFEVLTVSIDPGEGPELARQKKHAYLQSLGQPGAEAGWHFLTGEQGAISALAASAGFEYRYLADEDEYAHPTGVVILTPEGQISRYILGIGYSANDLRLGLVDAAGRKIATLVDQFYLLCYQYDPVTGRYTLLIHRLLQAGGALTALGLGMGVFFLRKAERGERP